MLPEVGPPTPGPGKPGAASGLSLAILMATAPTGMALAATERTLTNVLGTSTP